jgi:uncharacterized protein YukJ
MGSASEGLTLLLEERSILRTLHRYCHAMDYGLEKEWVQTFTDEAVFDVYRMPDKTPIHREVGADDLAKYIRTYPRPPEYRKHIIVDPIMEIEGDEARVESLFFVLMPTTGTGGVIRTFGRYRDRLQKIEGSWRIAERLAEVEA